MKKNWTIEVNDGSVIGYTMNFEGTENEVLGQVKELEKEWYEVSYKDSNEKMVLW